mmetsp:Transcript_11958/g.30737  ORF Transcript_11958/g.30737 Transcript_11958/m.30737 type:complete len:219 (-) Transcript_11958:81-737(-)
MVAGPPPPAPAAVGCPCGCPGAGAGAGGQASCMSWTFRAAADPGCRKLQCSAYQHSPWFRIQWRHGTRATGGGCRKGHVGVIEHLPVPTHATQSIACTRDSVRSGGTSAGRVHGNCPYTRIALWAASRASRQANSTVCPFPREVAPMICASFSDVAPRACNSTLLLTSIVISAVSTSSIRVSSPGWGACGWSTLAAADRGTDMSAPLPSIRKAAASAN